jgi:hypothetical protein
VLALSLWGAWNWWSRERHESVPPGIVAPASPAQVDLDPVPTLAAKDHTFHARARYEITARVLRNADIDALLRRPRPGEVVTLRGYLVDVRGPNGFRWNTSLRRDDTGDGACELMWVEQVLPGRMTAGRRSGGPIGRAPCHRTPGRCRR